MDEINKSDVGIFGLGIMGQNLALNFERHGYVVSVTNRAEEDLVAPFIAQRCQNKKIAGFSDPEKFLGSLKPPRKILLLVKAGLPVDTVLDQLAPFLEDNDIVIDGGNSHYKDTQRRLRRLESRGVLFVGCGVSGGGDGALHGPAIMPGGSAAAWAKIKPLLQSIAAKSSEGDPCCDWIGPEGSGHFVKMVHNGIEYALMQILAEAFDVQKRLLSMPVEAIGRDFEKWNTGELKGFLLEITACILKFQEKNGQPLIDGILDCAEQKGTGKDIAISALELGVPVTVMNEALTARYISCMLDERRAVSNIYSSCEKFRGDAPHALKALRDAVHCTQIIAHAQGFRLLDRASSQFGWDLDLAKIARTWRGGCIIQSDLINDLANGLQKAGRNDILLETHFSAILNKKQTGWRYANGLAAQYGIPIPALSSALSYFDGLRTEYSPANLIQAQRDLFGAHGFERRDAPRNVRFHFKRGDKNASL